MSTRELVRTRGPLLRSLPLLLASAAVVLTAAKAKQCVPTPQELICEADSDCGGPAPEGVTCEGGWACIDASCEWVCDPIEPVCYSSSECGPGQHCSVDDGVCDPPAGCWDGNCFAACAGTCVDDQQAFCYSDYDCPKGQICEYGYTPMGADGGAAGAAAPWCPPCDDPTQPCDCGGVPMQGVCVDAPAPEVCDGMDNDGDGLVDEDGVCGGECWSDYDCPSGWTCEGAAEDCAYPTDADPATGVAIPCYMPPGQCTPPTQECWSDWDCPEGSFCETSPDYYCPPCDPNGVCAPCLPPWGYCTKGAEEICDGLDNDGDGWVDEDEVCGPAMCWTDSDCPKGQLCEFGTCPPCVPGEPCPACLIAQWGYCTGSAPELCDGIDNDKDGVVDEGCGMQDECAADSDCAKGEMCIAQGVCWDWCDPATGACGGGCGTQYLCVATP